MILYLFDFVWIRFVMVYTRDIEIKCFSLPCFTPREFVSMFSI